MSLKYPSIPEPEASIESLLMAVKALKINIEILTAQRSTRAEGVATLQDLVDLGLVDQDELPS